MSLREVLDIGLAHEFQQTEEQLAQLIQQHHAQQAEAQQAQQAAEQQDSASDKPQPEPGTDEWLRQRRESHKEVERRRREHINQGISELAKIVPNCTDRNKGGILHRAVAYIAQLKETEARNAERWTLDKMLADQAINDLSAYIEYLKAENEQLRTTISDLGGQLPARLEPPPPPTAHPFPGTGIGLNTLANASTNSNASATDNGNASPAAMLSGGGLPGLTPGLGNVGNMQWHYLVPHFGQIQQALAQVGLDPNVKGKDKAGESEKEVAEEERNELDESSEVVLAQMEAAAKEVAENADSNPQNVKEKSTAPSSDTPDAVDTGNAEDVKTSTDVDGDKNEPQPSSPHKKAKRKPSSDSENIAGRKKGKKTAVAE